MKPKFEKVKLKVKSERREGREKEGCHGKDGRRYREVGSCQVVKLSICHGDKKVMSLHNFHYLLLRSTRFGSLGKLDVYIIPIFKVYK